MKRIFRFPVLFQIKIAPSHPVKHRRIDGFGMICFKLAEYLDVIPEICQREPSPDTFSLPVNDQEFFFRIPFDSLDFLLYAWEHDIPDEKVCEVMNLTDEQVKRAKKDFEAKNNATKYLRQLAPTLE